MKKVKMYAVVDKSKRYFYIADDESWARAIFTSRKDAHSFKEYYENEEGFHNSKVIKVWVQEAK